ncbi:molybdopterin-dependent oxidoreductase [Brevibacterium oceani]|uniref:molybdopterin-dependent oxidoreductase n=1 Tax=Brevibacterium oceani TaxID=358099 RepID=UPI0015E6950A|nr:molybdopterin-dependent oxidoreductase [Brevibacterium oceani]
MPRRHTPGHLPNDRLTELRSSVRERLGAPRPQSVHEHTPDSTHEQTTYSAQKQTHDSVRGPRTAVVIGRLLGLTFVLCFATGIWSHYLQDPLPWMRFPTRPAVLYQVTQGVHVAAGLASVPLLLAKLWTVYPRLFTWPPITSAIHALERGLTGVLVASSLLELTIGVMNIYHWYAWPFSFRTVHYALAWVIVGSLLAHIAFQLPTIRQHWRSRPSPRRGDAAVDVSEVDTGPAPIDRVQTDHVPADSVPADHVRTAGSDRRAFLASVAAASVAVVGFTAGQSTRFLSAFNLFGPRRYGDGPQGLPVNRTAAAADVLTTAADPAWTLEVRGNGIVHGFSRSELEAMDQSTEDIPIACVEGWSTSARWTGVRVRDVLTRSGIDPHSRLRVTSLQTRGGYAVSEMGPEFAADELTLIALGLNGEPLDLDHGYPARIIAPGRPGVLQTKWISTIEVIG